MKALIEAKRKELAAQERRDEIKIKRRKTIEMNKRIEDCAQKIINKFKAHCFDPDKDSDDIIAQKIAEKLSGTEGYSSIEKPYTCQIWVFKVRNHYQDQYGRYKSLLPEVESLWPSEEHSTQTEKVKNKTLKEFFQKVEERCDIECYWAYGYSSHTTFNLNVRMSSGLFMLYTYKKSNKRKRK